MRFLFAFIIVMISAPLSGENSELNDSIQLVFIKEQAEFASEKAWGLKNSNPDSSFYYANLALQLARSCSDQTIEAYSLADIGNFYKRKENYKKALDYYHQSLNVRYKLNDDNLIAGGYNQIGLLYQQQEKYDTAVVYFELGLKQLKPQQSNAQRLKLLNGYSLSLYRVADYDKALTYIDSAFFLANELNDSSSIAKLLQNKGNIHHDLGQIQLASKFYVEARNYYGDIGDINGMIDMQINLSHVYLIEGDLQEAENMLLRAKESSLELGLNYNIPTIYYDLGLLYLDIDKTKSEAYYEKAYFNSKKMDKVPFQIEIGMALGKLKLELGKNHETSELINELEVKLSNSQNIAQKIEFFQLKSDYYRTIGDFKNAFKTNEMSLLLTDSLYKSLDKVKELSALLEITRQEKRSAQEQLKRKGAERETAFLQNKVDRIIMFVLIAVIVVLVLIVLLVIRNYKNKTQTNRIRQEKFKQEHDFKNQINQLTYAADLKFLEESLLFEEEIRKDIGKDLHDHLASKLAVIQINLDSIAESEDAYLEKLNPVIELVEESCNDVRVIAHNLIGKDRLKESLSDTLIRHCKTINNSGKLKITFNKIGDTFDIDTQIKKNLLATTVLLVDNIIRHAEAKNASLELFYHDDSINLVLNDDGVGFDSNNTDLTKGVGLMNAKERINQVNGTLEINTRIKHGTTITVSIPLEDER